MAFDNPKSPSREKLTSLLLLLVCGLALGQIQKVEPPHWWTGMVDTELQLLVYGNQIAGLQPEFSNGAEILKVTQVDNPNYLFLTVETKNVRPGMAKLSFKKGKGTVEELDYEFKARREGSAQRRGFDSSDVVYLLMPDRFANGDPTNDSHRATQEGPNRDHPGGRHGGDIQGIIDQLDYLQELGATALWSTPLTLDNEKTYSYHGYACADLYLIDPRFGSNEDYSRLSAELHQRDMKLIMDFVPNHWGISHWLIQDLPAKDWIHYWEGDGQGFKRSNYIQSSQFDPYAATDDAQGNEKGWFDNTMPDMNHDNPLLIDYLVQNAIWWIESADLDGLRVDTYPYNDRQGITQWVSRVMAEYPQLNIMGEILMHDVAHIAFWQKDSKLGEIRGFNSMLPTVMDFPLHDIIPQTFRETDQQWDQGMYRIYDHLTKDFLYPDINKLLIMMGNHDLNRINQEFKGDLDQYKLAFTLLMTLRGIPQIYYGDEIGMMGDKAQGDGDIRRDFPGGWASDPQNAFLALGRTERQRDYFDFSKKLLNWRKGKKSIHTGKTLHYAPRENVYVYFRYLPGQSHQRVMVVLNNSDKPQTLDLDRFSQGLEGHKNGLEVISGERLVLDQKLALAAKTALVIELD